VKIAVWHNLPSGGGKRALYDHVRGLVERGHYVEAWCPTTADASYLPLGDMVVEHRLPLRWPPALGLLGRAAAPYRRIVAGLRAMDEHCRMCAEQIGRGGFDLLFANSCQFFRVTAIGRFADMPGVLYLQEPYRWLYEAMPQLPWLAPAPLGDGWRRPAELKRRLGEALRVRGLRVQARAELLNAQAYDTILANSLYSRESILRAYGLDAKVCYLGVDAERFAPRDLPKANLVVGIGALVREKNVDFVIEALGQVREPRPRLAWIGNVAVPGYLDYLKQLAAARGVAFEPHIGVGDDALLDMLGRALAMAYAPRLEPFGLAPLEANACGLPVVAVAEGGVRETVQDGVNGMLVEPEPAAMARAIERLRDDPAEARRMGQRGRRLVRERWSLPAAIDRLERSFDETLASARAKRQP
jgi:glycosyltransferase involved in cell wall biosynthesis